jgi:hypothetical protein
MCFFRVDWVTGQLKFLIGSIFFFFFIETQPGLDIESLQLVKFLKNTSNL